MINILPIQLLLLLYCTIFDILIYGINLLSLSTSSYDVACTQIICIILRILCNEFYFFLGKWQKRCELFSWPNKFSTVFIGLLCSSDGKESAFNAGDLCLIPRSLEKGMATNSNILAWRIPRTEEPGGLQSVGLQRIRHDWVTNTTTTTTVFMQFQKFYNSADRKCYVFVITHTTNSISIRNM